MAMDHTFDEVDSSKFGQPFIPSIKIEWGLELMINLVPRVLGLFWSAGELTLFTRSSKKLYTGLPKEQGTKLGGIELQCSS